MNLLHKSFGLGVITLFLITPIALYAQGPTTPNQEGLLPPPHVDGGKPPLKTSPNGNIHPMPIRPAIGTTSGKGVEGEAMRGGRIMASDTRPLPPSMQKNIDLREGTSGRMVNSGTNTDMRLRGGKMSGASSTGERGDIRERIGEHRAEIFKHSGDMMLKRMHAAIDRFTKLADRIDSRIKKMKANGTDTSLAETALGNARTKTTAALQAITEAESAINTVADAMSSGTSTPASSDEKRPAKEALEKARLAILAAGQSLNDVIPLLVNKQGDKRGSEHGTSTLASGTPKLPGMMRTKDRPMPTTTTGHPDGTL